MKLYVDNLSDNITESELRKIFEKYGQPLKRMSLVAMLVIPFLLYASAMYGSVILVNGLLALMGLSMLVAMKVG